MKKESGVVYGVNQQKSNSTILRRFNLLILFLKFSAGDEFVVTGGIDDAVKIWAVGKDQLELRNKLEGHALGVVSVDTSYDGKCNV